MAHEAKIDQELIDKLLAGEDPKTVLSSDGLLGELKKALAERMLDAEMDVHLEGECPEFCVCELYDNPIRRTGVWHTRQRSIRS